MPQGPLKAKAKATGKPEKAKIVRNAGITKKGQRTIAPKRKNLQKQANFQKQFSAQLTGGTEKRLAERAGHLELLAGGKKNKKGGK